MSSESKPLELNARWVYLRAFLLVFLVCQIAVWHHVQRLPTRHRLIVFLLAPNASMRSLLVALVAGGVVTALAIVLLHLVLRPLVKLWFNPVIDSCAGVEVVVVVVVLAGSACPEIDHEVGPVTPSLNVIDQTPGVSSSVNATVPVTAIGLEPRLNVIAPPLAVKDNL